MSLLGLVRHLAKVERSWFRQRAADEPIEVMYDPSRGKGCDFDDVDPSYAEADFARLREECLQAISRRIFLREVRDGCCPCRKIGLG